VNLHKYYSGLNGTTSVLLALAIIMFAGFLMTRLTKLLKLPNVTGYIIAGILIGPSVFGLVSKGFISNMGFVSDIALAFIAFDVGKFFKKEMLKKTSCRIFLITFFEALLSGALVTLLLKIVFKLPLSFSFLLGAIATATSPASIMMTINQYHARGDFVNTLLQVITLNNVICLFVFSITTSIITANSGTLNVFTILMPIIYNFIVIIIGFLCGLLLGSLLRHRSKDNRLIIAVAMLLGLAGICTIFNISPLLSCMVFGATYINFKKDNELYKQLNNFTPPIMSLFFVLSGMSLNFSALKTAGLIGISFFLLRFLGKYIGAYLGSMIARKDQKTRKYLGLALLPQAGVAIGLAFLGVRMLPEGLGNMLLTIVLSSSVLFELIGPACAKMSLFCAGSIPKECKKPEEVKELI
jgi:Kef-type K+ transport system membrane component KefB